MLVLGEHGDAFGGEDGVDAEGPEEVGSGGAEEEAELGQREELDLAELILDVGDLLQEAGRSVVAEDALPVHVPPPSLVVYESNYVIEDRFYPLRVALGKSKQLYCSLDDLLGLLVAVEEGVELVHNIRLTVFLRRFKFLLRVSLPPFLSPQSFSAGIHLGLGLGSGKRGQGDTGRGGFILTIFWPLWGEVRRGRKGGKGPEKHRCRCADILIGHLGDVALYWREKHPKGHCSCIIHHQLYYKHALAQLKARNLPSKLARI